MTTFVLVHGAWHGGWCWARVRRGLRRRGHRCVVPTLTGLGDRSHLLSRSTGLEVHIRDVVGTIEAEELEDVVLVGHSYAGQLVPAVVDRLPGRIRHAVTLDGSVPYDGESVLDVVSGSLRDRWAASVEDGWLLPPAPAHFLGIKEARDVAWVTRRLTPHPWKAMNDRLRLEGKAFSRVPKTFVLCNDPPKAENLALKRVREDRWNLVELPTGHDAMVTAPDALAEVLQRL
ncbi:MAG: alpha/beta hydrolase [Alphaproteobacteria bacterium]|nr:alpha/beta hydrolase [Alphaproteobacteria bacterium]